jgi:hypothetical protein
MSIDQKGKKRGSRYDRRVYRAFISGRQPVDRGKRMSALI